MRQIGKGLAALAAAGVISGMALAGCAASAAPEVVTLQSENSNVISVNSREQVMVEPDMAEVIYSVYSQASDADTCQTQNGTDLEAVLALLREKGVEDASIQTSNYGMNPIYDWESGKTIAGYEMTTQVTVSDIPIEQVGQLLSDSVEAGINSIDSVSYLCSSYDEAYQEALRKAVDAAAVKAQVLAEAGGCELGDLVSVEEHSDSQELRYNSKRSAAFAAEAAGAAMDMAVMPGQVEIEADITVRYEVRH